MARTASSPLNFLQCDGWKDKSNQADCRTYTKNGKLTYANKYSIRGWSHDLSRRENSYDEKTLIQPIIFPVFLKEILNFTNLDYVPERRNNDNKAPDFTPIDTFTHPFIFETKGSDSKLNDFAEEFFHNKISNSTIDLDLLYQGIRKLIIVEKAVKYRL